MKMKNDDRILELRRSGMTQTAIAAELGCSQISVSRSLRRSGAPGRNPIIIGRQGAKRQRAALALIDAVEDGAGIDRVRELAGFKPAIIRLLAEVDAARAATAATLTVEVTA